MSCEPQSLVYRQGALTRRAVIVSGSFLQTGGNNTANALQLGYYPGSSGNYTLSGSSSILSAANENLGGGNGVPSYFSQLGGSNSATLLTISIGGTYSLAGGTLQIGQYLQNQGVFIGGGTPATLLTNGILDLTTGSWQNLGNTALSVSPSGLLVIPAGYNISGNFASYGSLGLTYTVGSTFTVPAGRTLTLNQDYSINDPVNCQGTLNSPYYPTIKLNNGLILSGNGVVNLSSYSSITINDSTSQMTGGSLTCGAFYVGSGGTGSFSQSGGVGDVIANQQSGLTLGNSAGDVGNYVLSNGTLYAQSPAYVGYAGIGTFTQTGGSAGLDMTLGYSVGGRGTYILSGASHLGNRISSQEVIGYYGTGTIMQSGGTNSNGNAFPMVLYLGYYSGGTGIYSLGGSGTVLSSTEYVGYYGNGTFSQSGGINSISVLSAPYLYIGYEPGSSGTYNLSNGNLTASLLYVGASGNGVFTQTGGTNSSTLYVGSGGTGAYYLSGGIKLGGDEYVGNAGAGLFVQSGGTNVVEELHLEGNVSGVYDLEGGILRAFSLLCKPGLATFNFTGGTLQAGSFFLGTGFSSTASMTLGSDNGGATFDSAGYTMALSGPLSGSGSLTKVGSGALILAATDTYTRRTLVSSGTLVLRSPLALWGSTLDTSGSGNLSFGTLTAVTLGGLTGPGAILLSNTKSVALILSVGNNGASTTYSGALSAAGSLIKIGNGSLDLTGAETYAGTTVVNQGELMVNGSLVSPVTVNSGGTLAGMGSLSSVTVAASGHLAPGDAPGTLALSGSLSLLSGSKIDYELDTPLDSDMVLMTSGALSLNGQQFSDFNFTPLGGFGPGTYDLINAGSVSGSLGSGTTGMIDGLPATLVVQGDNLVLNVVPEPGTIALIVAGASCLVGWSLSRLGKTVIASSAQYVVKYLVCPLAKPNLSAGAVTLVAFFPGTILGSYIYVANEGAGTVGLYTSSGAPVNPNLITGLVGVEGLAVADGYLYVSTFGNNAGSIGKYSLMGAPINTSLITGLYQPTSIAVSGTDLYVNNAGTSRVGKYTTSGGTINSSFISVSGGGAESVAVSGSNVFVAISGNYRIAEYSTTTGGTVNDNFIPGVVTGYSLAASGSDLYVMNSRTSGGFVSKYTTSGILQDASLVSGLDDPYGIAVDGSDLYVSSFFPNSIVGKYTTSGGTIVPSLISTGLNRPYGIAVTAAIPEPTSPALLLASGVGLLGYWRRRKRPVKPSVAHGVAEG